MPVDDPSDVAAEQRELKKMVERLLAGRGGGGGGDSGHVSTGGPDSVALGSFAEASNTSASAFGAGANASGQDSCSVGTGSLASGRRSGAYGPYAVAQALHAFALGYNADASHEKSTAIGYTAATSATWQIMLGQSSHTVVVPGTFSNPSARRLKQNITPAPDLQGMFPELVEYEKKAAPGPRHLGYIADDLVGTPAERFVTFDDDGKPNGIAYQDLHTAQIAALLARIEQLESKRCACG